MNWEAPGRAIRIVVHDRDGGVYHYSRDEDDDVNAIWREGRPDEVAPAS